MTQAKQDQRLLKAATNFEPLPFFPFLNNLSDPASRSTPNVRDLAVHACEMNCPICLDQIGGSALCLPCGHIYCAPCLQDFVEKTRTRAGFIMCPTCRRWIDARMTQDCIRKVFLNDLSSDSPSGSTTAPTLDVEVECVRLRTELHATTLSRDEAQSDLIRLSASNDALALDLEGSREAKREQDLKLVAMANAKTQLQEKLSQVMHTYESHRQRTDAEMRFLSEENERQKREIALLKDQLATAGRRVVAVKTEPIPVVIKQEPAPITIKQEPAPITIKQEPTPTVIKSEPTAQNVWNANIYGDGSDGNSGLQASQASTSGSQSLFTFGAPPSSTQLSNRVNDNHASFTFGNPVGQRPIANMPRRTVERNYRTGTPQGHGQGSSNPPGPIALVSPEDNTADRARRGSGYPASEEQVQQTPVQYTPINVQSRQAIVNPTNRRGGGRPITGTFYNNLQRHRALNQLAEQTTSTNASTTPSSQDNAGQAGESLEIITPHESQSNLPPTGRGRADASQPQHSVTPPSPAPPKREFRTGDAILYTGYGRPKRTPVPECISLNKSHHFSGKGTNQYATKYTCKTCGFSCSESKRW